MKETPLLFSAPMVRALLAGTKTQTRRIVKPQPTWVYADKIPVSTLDADPDGAIRCPYGHPGDRIWAKETWRTYDSLDDLKPTGIRPGAAIHYRAGGSNIRGVNEPLGMGRWRPSIFMCRWMSRITLELTAVRVERLQDISEEDAIAEGVWLSGTTRYHGEARDSYHTLWESINGKGSWAANPWLWVLTFKRITP